MNKKTLLFIIFLAGCVIHALSDTFHAESQDVSDDISGYGTRSNYHNHAFEPGTTDEDIEIDRIWSGDFELSIMQQKALDNSMYYYNYYARIVDGSKCSGDVLIPATFHYANDSCFWQEKWGSGEKEIVLDNDIPVWVLEKNAFKDNDRITSVAFETVPVEGNGKVYMLSPCRFINESCFEGCASLAGVSGFKWLDLANTLRKARIGKRAFAGCTNLRYFNPELSDSRFPCDIVFYHSFIWDEAFEGVNLTSLMLKDSYADSMSFASKPLREIIVENGIDCHLYKDSFKDCNDLAKIIILGHFYNKDRDLYVDAFNGCNNIKQIDFHGVGVNGHQSIYLPNRTFGLEQHNRLEEINLYVYPLKEGYVWEGGECYLRAEKINVLTAPVYQGKFDDNLHFVVSVGRGETVTFDCPYVKPSTMYSSIGTLIIKHIEELKKSTIYLSNIVTLVLPESLKIIREANIEQATSIGKIICNATTPPELYLSEWYMLQHDPDGKTYEIPIYVPEGCVDAYKSSEYWKDSKNIREIGESGIEDVSPDIDAYIAEIYTLDGRLVNSTPDTLSPGIYVVRTSDGKTSKIAVR